MKVRWLRRNRPVGAIPFILREEDLPRRQRVLVLLPHSDDGRYIGATLSLMNSLEGGRPRNRVRIVVVCPGYRSVEGPLTNEEKSQIRWKEALGWGEALGFSCRQMTDLRADRTYISRCCAPEDQRHLDALVAAERPTMVFLPHPADVAQHANYCTRAMMLRALVHWLGAETGQRQARRGVFLVEYPTLHVPILPPADKTIIVAFADPAFAAVKHEANKFHKSQEPKHFDVMGRFVEAIDAMSGADTVFEARRAGERYAKYLSEVPLNPVKSRGEHFGLTLLRLKRSDGAPLLVESRVRFPLSPRELRLWGP